MNISINVYRVVTKLLTDIVKESREKIELTNEKINELLRNSKKETRDDDVKNFIFYLKLINIRQDDIYTANLILDRIKSIEEIKTKKFEENQTES